jgi:hypothetical protein
MKTFKVGDLVYYKSYDGILCYCKIAQIGIDVCDNTPIIWGMWCENKTQAKNIKVDPTDFEYWGWMNQEKVFLVENKEPQTFGIVKFLKEYDKRS